MANIIKMFFTYERLIHSHAAVAKDGHHWVTVKDKPEQLEPGMEFKLPDGTVCKLIERGQIGAGKGWWAEKVPKPADKSKDIAMLEALAKMQHELDVMKFEAAQAAKKAAEAKNAEPKK